MTQPASFRNNAAWQCLFLRASEQPDLQAIELWSPTRCIASWSYGQAATRTASIAAALRQMGVNSGDRVLIRLKNHPDFAFAFFATVAAAAVAIPCSPTLTTAELNLLAQDSGARFIISDPELSTPDSRATALLHLCLADLPTNHTRDGWHIAPVLADEPAWMVYTSGTTSRPKGVIHAHRAVAGRRPMRAAWTDIQPTDRVMHAGTLNWTYTMGVGVIDAWTAGATSIVVDTHPQPADWPALWEASATSIFASVPSLYRRILKYARLDGDTAPRLRHALSAGETLREHIRRHWMEQTGRPIYEALGMSECSTYVSYGPSIPWRAGSVGRIQPARQVRLVDPANVPAPAPIGSLGVLAIHRSEPGLMLGYHDRPEEERACFVGDWFLTGDLAHSDEDGYLYFQGRSSDLLNVSGFRISPLEIEAVLNQCTGVIEAAVGMTTSPDDVDLLTAWVVTTEQVDLDALKREAAVSLASYKLPKVWQRVHALPRTPTGKLRRPALGADEPASPRLEGP